VKANNIKFAYLKGFALMLFAILQTALSGTGASAAYNIQDIPADNTVDQTHVVLRALDKITARITEIEIPINSETKFGTLIISAKYCRTRPPIEPPETYTYLIIDDVKRDDSRDRVFEGWMVASSPALNALEHPIYDVWVINCKTASPE
jgi:hypothetical protein